jgi:ATP-binding cassette subfamily B protein
MKPAPPNLLTVTTGARDHDRKQRPLDLSLIRRLFTYTRPHRVIRNWLTLLVIVRAIQLPLLAWSIGTVINGAITRGEVRGAILGALGFGLLAAFTQITLIFRMRLAQLMGERVIHDLRRALFTHILAMPMSFHNRMKLGRIISRMTTDVDAVRVGVQDVFFVTCVQGGQMIVSALMMLFLEWRLFLVVLALAPVIWTLNRIFRMRLSMAQRDISESFSRVTATLAESVNGIRVTQGFVRQEVNANLFEQLARDHSQYNVTAARTSGTFLPLLELSSQGFTASLLLVGCWLVMSPDHHMSVGTLIQFFFLANVFFHPIQSLGNLYNQAMTAMAGAERIFRLLDTPPEWSDPPSARDIAVQGRVELRNVTFGYDPKRPVLNDISLTAEPGQTIALVGHTGSGKSSIINLIAKFYLPQAGEILIDGVPLAEISGPSLHRQMALIQQQNFVFTGTVMDNIRVGRPDASDEDVIAAARRLDCLDLLECLPEGLQTRVGEKGSGLSLGQRQLVCFVRALLADPRILILDEATSSIDTMTEVRIQKALSALLQGRTCFVIAHRLSTVRNANQVLVLDRGRVAERGTHIQLLAQRGIYSNLYRQFARLGLGGSVRK